MRERLKRNKFLGITGIVVFCALILVSGCAERKQDVPKDFQFSFVWGVYGDSAYDSQQHLLIKDQYAKNKSEYTTKLVLSEQQKQEIWDALHSLDWESYPKQYDPNPDLKSEPSLTLELRFSYGDVEKTVACRGIGYSYESSDKDGQKFLSACKFIQEMIMSTDEWNSLPEYETHFQ